MKNLLLLSFLFISSFSFAQDADKTVSITVSGSGKTQEQAKQVALRSAIEQAFGTFISSITEVLEEQVVSDDITSVANGNIQNFTILNAAQLPDSTWGVTLRAIVSVDKLTKFVQSKGVTIQIKGGLFAINIKQQILNEQAEIKAISSLVGLLHEPMQQSFDYVLKSSEPKSLDAENKNWEIPLVVTATANKNMDFCANYFIKTISSLSLSPEEVTAYKNLNKPVFIVNINYKGISNKFYLRKLMSMNALNTFQSNWEFYTRLFVVESGIDKYNGIGRSELFEFCKIDDRDYKSNIPLSMNFNFINSEQQAATFSYTDKRTLSQIENMNSYSITPRGVISKFKQGGYVVYEKDGIGLVVSLFNIGEYSKDSSIVLCNNFESLGYSDWIIPSVSDFQFIYDNLYLNKVGNFELNSHNLKYWTRNKSSFYTTDDNSTLFDFRDGKFDDLLDFRNYSEKNNLRPIRYFNLNGNKFDLNSFAYNIFLNKVGGLIQFSNDIKDITFNYERDVTLVFDHYDKRNVKYNHRYICSDSAFIFEEFMPKLTELSTGSFVIGKSPDSSTSKYLLNYKINKNIGCDFFNNFNINEESITTLKRFFNIFSFNNLYSCNLNRKFLFETNSEIVYELTKLDSDSNSKQILIEFYSKNTGYLVKRFYTNGFPYQKPLIVEFSDYDYIKNTKYKFPYRISYSEFEYYNTPIIYKLIDVNINNNYPNSFFEKL